MGAGQSRLPDSIHLMEYPEAMNANVNVTLEKAIEGQLNKWCLINQKEFQTLLYPSICGQLRVTADKVVFNGSCSLQLRMGVFFFLTCGHNLVDNNVPVKQLSIEFQRTHKTKNLRLQPSRQPTWPPLYKGQQENYDLGIIYVDQMTIINLPSFIQIHELRDCKCAKKGDIILVIGYPHQVKRHNCAGHLYEMKGTIKDIVSNEDHTILHYKDIDTHEGQSGAPILWFSNEERKWFTIGVHIGFDKAAGCNRGVGINENMMKWIDEQLTQDSQQDLSQTRLNLINAEKIHPQRNDRLESVINLRPITTLHFTNLQTDITRLPKELIEHLQELEFHTKCQLKLPEQVLLLLTHRIQRFHLAFEPKTISKSQSFSILGNIQQTVIKLELDLSHNDLRDMCRLSSLGQLNNLQELTLNLTSNNITEVKLDYLAVLKNLKKLVILLNNNQIVDTMKRFDFLEQLPKLTTLRLYLGDNLIQDATPLIRFVLNKQFNQAVIYLSRNPLQERPIVTKGFIF